jgi:hypothetical protein
MSGTPSPHMIKLTGKKWLTAAIVVVVAVLALKTLMPEKKRPVAEENNPQNECAYNAVVQYNNSKLGLSPQTSPPEQLPEQLLSVDRMLAERRLEEQFCLQFARCVFPDPTVASLALQLGAAFNRCLRNEALEKYDAVLREP